VLTRLTALLGSANGDRGRLVHGQARALRHAVVAVLLPGAAVMGLALWIGDSLGVPPSHLLRDPLSVPDRPPYAGALSNAGVLGWAVIAAAAGGAAAVVRHLDRHDDAGRYLLRAAALTATLTVDDFFQVHDRLAPVLGVPEKAVMAGYVIATFALCWRYRRFLLGRTPVSVLALAVVLFGVGLAVDQLWHSEAEVQQIAEDGPKLLGILAWGAFHLPLSRRALLSPRAVRSDEPARDDRRAPSAFEGPQRRSHSVDAASPARRRTG